MTTRPYKDEEFNYIRAEYEAESTRSTIDRLALELNRTPRSIIAKLSSAKIYKTPPKLTKQGTVVVHKDQLAKDIGEWFGLELPTLVKVSKLELQALHSALQNPDYIRAHLVDLEDE